MGRDRAYLFLQLPTPSHNTGELLKAYSAGSYDGAHSTAQF